LCAVPVAAAGEPQLIVARPGVTAGSYATKAESAYKSMQAVFGTSNNLLKETASGGNPYAYLWPMTQVSAGTADLVLINSTLAKKYGTAVADRMTGLEHYFDAAPAFGTPAYDSYVVPPLGTGGDKYLDDQAWAAWDLLRAYGASGNASYLTRAKQAFALIAAGWDSTSACGNAGGVYWKQQTPTEGNHDRNTVSTGSGAVVAMRLYQVTRDASYRDWAIRMVGWLEATLKDPADGLYWDNIHADCSIDRTKWTYNQGVVLLAKQLLGESGSGPAYLTDAGALIQAALSHFAGQYDTQDIAFNAIFFRAATYAARGNATLLGNVGAALQGYAEAQWNGDSHRNGVWYRPDGNAYAIDSGAMVQICALLGMPASAYPELV
jgi:hypothetical protein